MSETAIKVEGLGKKYIIGHQAKGGYKTFRDQIGDSLKTVFSKTKTMLSGQMVVEGDEMEEFWALKDVSFEVKQGETFGIIGRNGAGKSTLLKILSRITGPTTGRVSIKGRVASLLEVGTGFHPELTGRENIFLNGAILGMGRAEIKRKFDEIVDFSGVEIFLDTPVKRYSSGMYVRLAFSVAAYLEPEILIIDEVLAVGDAEFQKKCLGKMGDISKGEGRTVLFVSHNLQAVSSLTKRSVLLSQGKVVDVNGTSQIIQKYLQTKEENSGYYENNKIVEKAMIVRAIAKTSEPNFIHINGEAFEIEFEIYLPKPLRNGAFAFQVLNNFDIPIVHCWIFNSEQEIFNKKGINKLVCRIPKFRLYVGSYSLRLILAENSGNEVLEITEGVCGFKVEIFTKSRDYKWESGACTYLEDNDWEVL